MQKILPGNYPMLYSFFDDKGQLRLDPFRLQVDAAIANQATGIAILGLGTEVSKLTPDERIAVLDVVSERIDSKKPLLVTVYGDTPSQQITFARKAIEKGTSALILQPPSIAIEDARLVDFFAHVISSVECSVGIQNAPEFMGYGLSHQSLIKLAQEHVNFRIAKLECSAVSLQPVAAALQNKVMVFNGRSGLELPDNLRAGAQGIIPSIDTVDKTSEIVNAFLAGDESRADQRYTELAPVTAFVMQGIPHFLTYGKSLAAMRLGIELGGRRDPALLPTEFGTASVRRFAERLGRLEV